MTVGPKGATRREGREPLPYEREAGSRRDREPRDPAGDGSHRGGVSWSRRWSWRSGSPRCGMSRTSRGTTGSWPTSREGEARGAREDHRCRPTSSPDWIRRGRPRSCTSTGSRSIPALPPARGADPVGRRRRHGRAAMALPRAAAALGDLRRARPPASSSRAFLEASGGSAAFLRGGGGRRVRSRCTATSPRGPTTTSCSRSASRLARARVRAARARSGSFADAMTMAGALALAGGDQAVRGSASRRRPDAARWRCRLKARG